MCMMQCISSELILRSVRQVQRIPCEDHCPPLLVEVVRFCEDVAAWMRRDSRNVVAAHCKVKGLSYACNNLDRFARFEMQRCWGKFR